MIQTAHDPAPEVSMSLYITKEFLPPGFAAATVKKISLTQTESLGI
jgi:hypothetical protein